MVKNNGLTRYQIQELQEDVRNLVIDMKSIKENHIPHLQEEIISLKTRMNILSAINIGAIIFGIIAARVLK